MQQNKREDKHGHLKPAPIYKTAWQNNSHYNIISFRKLGIEPFPNGKDSDTIEDKKEYMKWSITAVQENIYHTGWKDTK